MKTKLLLILITFSLFQNLNAQSYNDLWKDVNKNLNDNLPQTAEISLNKIEQKAIKENQQKELLKTFLYRFRIFSLQDENPIETSIVFAEENISRLQEPERSIFNIATASLYESYMNENNYRINNNIPIDDKEQLPEINIKFWDRASFNKVISQCYEKALSDIEVLQKSATAAYNDILNDNIGRRKTDNDIEPTLYDYVVHKIVNHLVTGEQNFGDISVSELYQDLIDFDKKNNYEDAVIYNEIQKLKHENSDDYELYFKNLEKIKNEIIDNQLAASVMAMQASIIENHQIYPRQKALEICDEAIKSFPNSIGAKQCESIRSEILEKELTFSMQNVVLPNQDIPANISYRNLTNPHYRIYKLSQKELENLEGKSKSDIVKILLKKDYIVENHLEITEETDYQEHSIDISLPNLEYGTYSIMFSKDDKFSKTEEELPAIHSFQVSNLSLVTTKENNDFVIYVLDRESGMPIKDVNVNLYKQDYNYHQKKYVKTTIADLKTDKNGIARVSNTEYKFFYINLFKDDDKLLSNRYFYNHQDKSEEKLTETTTFFTDRRIYRPGQTVYYKGIILNQNSTTKELVVGKNTKVTLRDSNWQEVATQYFTTDESGAFDGSFVIPDNLANGYFSIENESGSTSFKVEEYKRPTFEIIFNNPDKSFRINEEIDLSGFVKAYAGFALDNVNYNYTIVRRSYFPYRNSWFADYNSSEKQIAFGEGKTNEKGEFNINFKLIPDANYKNKLPVYEYIVTINATNSQGETQTKSYSLKASEIDLIIDIEDNFKNISNDSLNLITFNVKNLKDNPVEAKIIRKIYKENDNESLTNNSLIYEDTINVKGNYGLFQNVNINLEKGKYVVELISADNELAKTRIELSIIDFSSNKMPYNTMCISYYDKASAQPGESVNFYLGSSAKNVRVYVMVKYGDEIRHYEHKTISDKILKVSYKIKEKDRGDISFQAFFVKDNTLNIVQHNVSVPYDNLKLDIKLDVERDDLLPGAEENWNITVKDFENKGVIANILAGMYDASLDIFAKNQWYFNALPNTKTTTIPKSDASFNKFSCSTDNQYYRQYNLFDYYLLSEISLTPSAKFHNYKTINAEEHIKIPKSDRNSTATSVGGVNYDFTMSDTDASTEEMVEITKQDLDEQTVENQVISIRENFDETAFFYPNLKTNEDGSLTFSFKTPDALTRWNLMMLAYTKDLKTGTLSKTFTTSKPMMIMSDIPRFCYENDTLWIVANVIKTTDKADDCQKAFAKLEIFDALTMQPLDLIISEQNIDLKEVAPGESRSVRWKVAFGKDVNLLAFRFSVNSDNFSDAEQKLLPILSDEVFMTETYPLTINSNSEETFSFDFNNKNKENQGLTLNFCYNPIWYAIQALPYLSQESGEYADVAFNIFYANSLASYIANNIPNLLNYIKEWKIETPDALMSQLQKDESLKAIMLKETPWVLEAKNENEQKSRIANLFDLNAIRSKTDEALNLISENQSVNGGWSWLPNMPESPFITQYLLSGFGRLYKMNVIDSLTLNQQNIAEIISTKAIKYLQDNIIEFYDTNKSANNLNPNYLIINELYALSFFNFEENSQYKNAKNFFVKKLEDNWHTFDFATQAKAALILHREENKNAAQLIMKSLKERMAQLQNTTNVETQTLTMEAFNEITSDNQLISNIMIGLLNNKRTNMWENARSSVDAIYAILETTKQLDNSTNKSVSIIANGQSLSQDQVFLQKYWNAEETSDFQDIKIKNDSDNPVWGGLFRQYFVTIDDVKKHESPLNIERNLYVERNNDEGSYLIPIENTEIKIGDKIIVKLTFDSPQDMEFVFLKDLRAACFEPTEQMSSYKYSDEMFYYQSVSDTFMGFYFDKVKKGKHQVSYSMYVTKEGNFSNGYALIQCMYAPEFSAYSEGLRITITERD